MWTMVKKKGFVFKEIEKQHLNVTSLIVGVLKIVHVF